LSDDKNNRRPPELLTRDVVAKAIRSERLAGRGSPHGGAFLDIASQRPADYIKKKLPSMYHQFKQLGNLDITTTPMEVGPTCHYVMGGVKVDPDTAATRVPGLFAAGEVAGGLHGANRLGGNSLTDLLVFGRRAGMGAVAYAKGLSSAPKISDALLKDVERTALAPYDAGKNENPYMVFQDLQKCMETNAGIVREKKEMETGLSELEALKARTANIKVEGGRQYNAGWHYALDLRNLLCVSQAITLSALHREESRGGHTREDFPDSSDELVKVNTVLRDEGGNMKWEHVARPEMPAELQAIMKQAE